MIQELALVFEEISAEIGREVAANPWRLVAEVVQFVLLFGIVWIVAMGTSKRRGFIANMLAERDERVHDRLDEASHAGETLAVSKQTASARLEAARGEAESLVSGARIEAEETLEVAGKDADAEADRIVKRAESALATERSEMELEIREELVDLVAQATRSVMSEKVSLAEQRQLIEGAILGSLGTSSSATSAAPKKAPGRRTRSVLTGAREES